MWTLAEARRSRAGASGGLIDNILRAAGRLHSGACNMPAPADELAASFRNKGRQEVSRHPACTDSSPPAVGY